MLDAAAGVVDDVVVVVVVVVGTKDGIVVRTAKTFRVLAMVFRPADAR